MKYEVSRLAKDQLNSYEQLACRGIPTSWKSQILNKCTDRLGQRAIWPIALLGVVFSIFLGFMTTCSKLAFFSECHEQISKETYKAALGTGFDLTINKDARVVRGPAFNGPVFSASLALLAFILAFARWHVSNKQSAMSEIFERKKATNLLIISNKTEVEDLTKAAIVAVRIENKERLENLEAENLTTRESISAKADEIKKTNPFALKEPTLIQRVFVYLEIDNLEFAHTKYRTGYLDAEQLFRACEIFESRCRSPLFLYIAANQGLTYYTEQFHDLLRICLILGYAGTPKEKDAKPKPEADAKDAASADV